MAEPNNHPGWTPDTLQIYLSSRIDALEKNVKTALEAADKAVTKSEAAMNERLGGMNEIRGMLTDNNATLLPRSEYATQYHALEDKFNILSTRIAEIDSALRGKSAGIGQIGALALGLLAFIGTLAGVGGIIVALLK